MIIDTRMRPMWGEFARQFTPGAAQSAGMLYGLFESHSLSSAKSA